MRVVLLLLALCAFLCSAFGVTLRQHAAREGSLTSTGDYEQEWEKFWSYIHKRRGLRAVRLLGSGYFASVFEVEDIETPGLHYALKVLLVEFRLDPSKPVPARKPLNRPVNAQLQNAKTSSDIIQQARVSEEQEQWKTLFAQVMDVADEHSLYHYAIMEYAGSVRLQDLIGKNELTPFHAAKVAMQLARAVSLLNAVGLSHRDLKPDNIHVKGSQIKIVDFGNMVSCSLGPEIPFKGGDHHYIPLDSIQWAKKNDLSSLFLAADSFTCPAFDFYSAGVIVSNVLFDNPSPKLILQPSSHDPAIVFNYRGKILRKFAAEEFPTLSDEQRHALKQVLNGFLMHDRLSRLTFGLEALQQYGPFSLFFSSEKDEAAVVFPVPSVDLGVFSPDVVWTAPHEFSMEPVASSVSYEDGAVPANVKDSNTLAARHVYQAPKNNLWFVPLLPVIDMTELRMSTAPHYFRDAVLRDKFEDPRLTDAFAFAALVLRQQYVYRVFVSKCQTPLSLAAGVPQYTSFELAPEFAFTYGQKIENPDAKRTSFRFVLKDGVEKFGSEEELFIELVTLNGDSIASGCFQSIPDDDSKKFVPVGPSHEILSFLWYSSSENAEDGVLELVQPEALVVGAGPVGLSAALEVIRAGMRPRIWERDVHFKYRHIPSGSALAKILEELRIVHSPIMQDILEALVFVLQLLDIEVSRNHEFVATCSIVGKGVVAKAIHWDSVGDEAKTALKEMLRASDVKQLEKWCSEDLSDVFEDVSSPLLAAVSGKVVTSRVLATLIGADGVHSRVAYFTGHKLEDMREIVSQYGSKTYRISRADDGPIRALSTFLYLDAMKFPCKVSLHLPGASWSGENCDICSSNLAYRHSYRTNVIVDPVRQYLAATKYSKTCLVELMYNHRGLSKLEYAPDVLARGRIPVLSKTGKGVVVTLTAASATFEDRIRFWKEDLRGLCKLPPDEDSVQLLDSLSEKGSPVLFTVGLKRREGFVKHNFDTYKTEKHAIPFMILLAGDSTRESFFPLGNGLYFHLQTLSSFIPAALRRVHNSGPILETEGGIVVPDSIQNYDLQTREIVRKYTEKSALVLLLMTYCPEMSFNNHRTKSELFIDFMNFINSGADVLECKSQIKIVEQTP